MTAQKKISAIILAGGKSSRFGSNKAFATYNGKPLLQNSIDLVQTLCDSVIVIGDKSLETITSQPVLQDILPEQGPAGGIYTGLFHSKTEMNLIVGVDLPLLSVDFLAYLLTFADKNFKAVVPLFDGHPQPLCALYSRHYLDWMQEAMQKGSLKMRNIIDRQQTYYLEIGQNLPFYSSLLFANINTLKDLENLKNTLNDEG